ncbi:NAD dependent epimerase/dehydratase family [Halalkaliarchaeum sp. AArc-CO]|uniref:DUF1611 domain-containing protein n=1 Tax=unclassified Halalkaliarchaeum TaxID=2678344 RepID=UPI00217E08DA|nr:MULTISPECIES: DUF1611 domain-containing protein [unclassified Halalkaliarchaeum]MDR5671726.1 DUF1611 domain-containing protein [Halalkaliarchaeum sp. AArc-GB]UWG51221.1 NAD dependent epimerase/dehydratase family [Halalkaliarchaeum sp. AArc-CO]
MTDVSDRGTRRVSDRTIAILAHEKFPDRAKTAIGVMRYGNYDVAAVIDREEAGSSVGDHVRDLDDAPIVGSFEEALEVESDLDTLLIGIAPIGGGFEESWRPDVTAAIDAGCDVISGLHYFLSEDEEFAALADQEGVELWDVRNPHEDLTVSEGVAADVDADVVLTVGTDCSVGKMTVSLELLAAARDRGIDAGFVPTGQTGIMIAGWGNPVDRVISDFTAGSVEEMILELGDEHDVLFVEGQGSIVHPAYSAVTCGILHGAMADALVLCHASGREAIHGYEEFSLPPLPEYVDLYESLAKPVHESPVVAGALNTREIDGDDDAREAVAEYSRTIGVPATDPVRFDAEDVLDAVLEGVDR